MERGVKLRGPKHFTLPTGDVEASRRFYPGILGFTQGPRPPLKFPPEEQSGT